MQRQDSIPDAAFDIPDALLIVDDPVPSGHLTVDGVGIRRQGAPKNLFHEVDAGAVDTLWDKKAAGYRRFEADAARFSHFRDPCGIRQFAPA